MKSAPVLAAVALALAAAAPAAELAAVSTAPVPASSHAVAVDARYELLGVVAQLAGLGPAGGASASYRQRIEKKFAPYRAHPAVELYKALAEDPAGAETLATIALYYTDPPELALKDANADIHYLGGEGRRVTVQRFLVELRAFARDSGFAGFLKENAPYYRELEAEARRALAGVDPAVEIEKLIGMPLNSRTHTILSPLARETHDFIVPYPLPPGAAGAKSFDVYSIPTEFLSHSPASVLPEPLYVFVDPSFYYFEKFNIPDPAAFYGAEIARCRATGPECTKRFLVAALVERLNRARSNAGVVVSTAAAAAPLTLEQAYVKALGERLDEYESRRDRYPTLWSFYPRLFSVFYEKAHAGKPAQLTVPAVRIRSAADFFDPAVAKRLTK